MFRFERLKVWHKAAELYDVVDEVADNFPPKARLVLVDQLRRAALSVPSNIAEGSGRESTRESRHFYNVAKGSAFEVVSIIMICRRRGMITDERHQELCERAEEISKMLTGLKRVPIAS